MKQQHTPYIPPELLDWLEERFSPEIPETMPEDPREYDYLAGQRHVVESIKRIATRQEGNLEDY